MKTTLSAEFAAAAKQSPRLFFAPLFGAINALRNESRRISEENKSASVQTSSKGDISKGTSGPKQST